MTGLYTIDWPAGAKVGVERDNCLILPDGTMRATYTRESLVIMLATIGALSSDIAGRELERLRRSTVANDY